MFDIKTYHDFHGKLKAGFNDFVMEPDSTRLALNCILTAYHLHEWVWAGWLKAEHSVWRTLGVRDKLSFVAWIKGECPAFKTMENLANGTKHFILYQGFETRHVGGYGVGPYGVGPSGKSYLLIEYGADEGEIRWKTADELIEAVLNFLNQFFEQYCLKAEFSASSYRVNVLDR